LCASSQVDGGSQYQWIKFNHARRNKQPGSLENHWRVIMNVRKNFEGLFLVAAAVGVFASYASAEPVVARLPQMSTVSAVAAPADTQAIPTVVVVGHRLTAAEKAQLG
jgi:hypothetical protein